MSEEQSTPQPDPAPAGGNGNGEGAGRALFREITGVGVDWRSALLVPVLAVFTAIVLGAFIIAITDIDALRIWGSQPGEAFDETWTTIKDAYEARLKRKFENNIKRYNQIQKLSIGSSPLGILKALAGLDNEMK